MPSPHRQGRRALAGALMIAALTATALVIFFLDSVVPLFYRNYTVVAVFPTAPGLRTGSPVWVAGVPAGTIRQIQLLPPRDTLARVALDLQLRQSVADQLRRDSRVRLASVQMVGEKVVEVLPGSAASPVLRDGDTLRVAPTPDASALMAHAGEVRLALDSLRTDAAALRRKFAQRQRDFAAALREAEAARKELAAFQAGLRDGSLAKLMAIQAPAGPLDRARKRAAEVRRLFARAQTRAGGARKELGPALGHARELQAQLEALRALNAQPTGTLARMQRDSALQHAMARARAQLDSLMTEARKKPWRFVF